MEGIGRPNKDHKVAWAVGDCGAVLDEVEMANDGKDWRLSKVWLKVVWPRPGQHWPPMPQVALRLGQSPPFLLLCKPLIEISSLQFASHHRKVHHWHHK